MGFCTKATRARRVRRQRYRSAANEATLKGRGFRSRIHVRAARGHPLSKAQAAANRAKSRIRARIEHVFGARRSRRAAAVAHHRHRAGADQDRLAELRLQRSPVATLNAGGLTRSNWRADWLPLEGGARPPRRKSRRQAANMRRYTNRCNVRSPIFDEIRHEFEVSRRSHRESVI